MRSPASAFTTLGTQALTHAHAYADTDSLTHTFVPVAHVQTLPTRCTIKHTHAFALTRTHAHAHRNLRLMQFTDNQTFVKAITTIEFLDPVEVSLSPWALTGMCAVGA